MKENCSRRKPNNTCGDLKNAISENHSINTGDLKNTKGLNPTFCSTYIIVRFYSRLMLKLCYNNE